MKILNWNVERLKHNKESVLKIINSFSADIIVLTETSSNLQLSENYNSLSTVQLPENRII